MRTIAMVWGLTTACGPAGPGDGTDGFGLNDVVLTGGVQPDGVGGAPGFFYIGWSGCPADVDCEALRFTVFRGSRSLELGLARDFPSVSEAVLSDLADVLLDDGAGPEVTIKWESSGSRAISGTFGPILCPDPVQNLRVTGDPPPIATPGSVQVAWDPLVGVAADSGELLAPNSSTLTATEWDDDLGLDLGMVHSSLLAASATSEVIALDNARVDIADRLLIEVSAGGEVFTDPQGIGEGTCNVSAAIAVDLR